MVPGSPAYVRQRAYADRFGNLDIIGYTLKKDGFHESMAGGLRVIPTNSPSRLLYGTNAILLARRLERPDVVSAQDPFESGLLAYVLSRMLGVPLHVQVHTDALSMKFGTHSILNFIRLHISLFVLKKADGIRVVSGRIKNSIEARMKPKREITVLPIYIDTARFRDARVDYDLAARFVDFKKRLVVVARLESEKNVALTIRSFAEAAPQDACLIIVGEGSERDSLAQLAHSCGVSARVFFEGAKDPSQYYKLADLVLVPSKYEGYGMVIVEALAARKPILATDVGIAREAGAIIADEETYADALAEWFKSGPETGELRNYPYKDFAEYVRAYCDDIIACVKE